MKYRYRRILAAAVVLNVVVSALSAQEIDLDRFRGEHPVIVVFSRDQNDDRPFVVNLALSTEWSGVTARDIQVLDVDPISYDVDHAAEELELGGREFAVVLIGRDGTTLATTDETVTAGELFEIFDRAERGDRE
ncbi:MAG: DUF4174 domain-containing protein [Alkalispirochaeta sp.]